MINLVGYQYSAADGYGRFAGYVAQALLRAGTDVRLLIAAQCDAPAWMHAQWGIAWSSLTLSILPPFYLARPPGRGPHWLYTMTEGSVLPDGWRAQIEHGRVDGLIVPCAHSAAAFRAGGLTMPIVVIPGGTDSAEFAPSPPHEPRPYTFLALADRGARKGWTEVWQAFYLAFGSAEQTPDVRLIIKSRDDGNELLAVIAAAANPDPRITIIMADMDMRAFYGLGDCLVIPSRSEGWGMPHREAAMMGLAVITQAYSGMDDGHTDKWATVLSGGRLEDIPAACEQIAGQWLRADVAELAEALRDHVARPETAHQLGLYARYWLKNNQTWDHTAQALLALFGGGNGANT